jgi:uncharacterized membrane protein
MEVIMRIMMTLTGLILGMLGMITAIHSDHEVLGILISFAGVVTMLSGLPDNQRNR